jgi:hypothetical protein
LSFVSAAPIILPSVGAHEKIDFIDRHDNELQRKRRTIAGAAGKA